MISRNENPSARRLVSRRAHVSIQGRKRIEFIPSCVGLLLLALLLQPGILQAAAAPDESAAQLIQALQDPDAIVRLRAAKSLGDLGPGASGAIEALTRALNDSDEDVRMVAKRALEQIRIQTHPELTGLIGDLKDPEALVRLQAAKRLGDLGADAAPALSALEQALADQDEDVQRVVRHAIDKIKASGSPAVQALIRQLQDPDPLIRLRAAKQLGDLGAEARPAAEALRAALEDPDEMVRIVAHNALKKLEATGTIPSDRAGADLTQAVDRISITQVERIFSPPEVGAAGILNKAGSMRFFVTLHNQAQGAIQVGTLRVRWLMGGEEIHNDDVEGPVLPLLGGQSRIHTFALRWDRDSKWDGRTRSEVEVALATPIDLDHADRSKLAAINQQLANIHIRNPQPIYTFGVLLGDRFTIQNSNDQICKGALIALRGYDVTDEWVHSLLYYAPVVPAGFTHVNNDSSQPFDGRRPMVKLIDYQNANASPEVKRYQGMVLAVGLAEHELPK